ncbi:MAG TPA: sugar transferase, partial [Candidatus Paceibacterota bacterium]
YKLRSMYENADTLGPLYTAEEDNRITRVGKIIRKFRIDELPQLRNILCGEMSFIGPRPLTGYEYDISDHDFNQRLLVLPGLSGLAQVSGGNKHTNEQKLKCDLNYIRHLSLKLDFKILCKTIVVILSGNGAR